ncbi:unnamed protein product (macronuclear) [Paramecium tetraurelia]|uniref:asparagine synthase (glutamine-hydrolyzing) n=1 Tax=Paramecium tetraurelia TaxID=5888 RepID=A0E625_PARTE|nr:uncharacterized protein GSPATT00003605001 [Paramecium tetraurelia]CAK90742.1 unnamed protein product [Paramecium tetraurelia]|eukprot:XP_001458139.1 hypothetical protein (macronuclear) [Paramecium tetraurelia strain d4-2]
MCGILAIFNIKGIYYEVRTLAYNLSKRQRHRGPDKSRIIIIEAGPDTYHILAHERLNIVDLSDRGRQPFQLVDDQNIYYMQNGELYNYWSIKPELEKKYQFSSNSDSEIVGMLYKEYGPNGFWNHMDGMHATILLDMNNNTFYAGRDHIGMIPLYYGYNKDGALFLSSELKAIHDQVVDVRQFPPGHFIDQTHEIRKWYNPLWHNFDLIPNGEINFQEMREKLIDVVRREIKGDAQFGLFISGGVNSSIVAGIVARMIKNGEIDLSKRGMSKVHSFCIGLEGSPDLHYAQKVADYHGFEHQSIIYTVEEALDYIPEVIYHTETFNKNTIRTATPMYLMCRRVKALGIKICLTGEGSDDLFGGYLYFHKAPNRIEFHQELIRKLNDLYKYDLLGTNKACLAWGIETRPPFMNRSWIEYVMSIDPKYKMVNSFQPQIEKYVLRKAFEDLDNPYVPQEILWRQKEQFSDGVGYGWRDGIIKRANQLISDQLFSQASITYPISTPRDKEQYWYRQVYSQSFPCDSAALTVPYSKSIACSTEKALEWDEAFKNNSDESGRAVVSVHKNPLKESQQEEEKSTVKTIKMQDHPQK